MVGLSAGLHKDYTKVFKKTWRTDEIKPIIQPIKFGVDPDNRTDLGFLWELYVEKSAEFSCLVNMNVGLVSNIPKM